MPTFEAYEAAMANGLKSIVGIAKVEEYSGDLSAGALKKIAPRDGGILMVPLGGVPAGEQPSTGQLAFVCRTGAFIITRSARGSVDRAKAARQLARSVMLTINNNQWALTDVYAAQIEKLENRSSGAADKAGYAIWLVVWKQTINLDELPVDGSSLPSSVAVQTGNQVEQVLS